MRKMTQALEGLLESSDYSSIIGIRLGDNMEIQQKRRPTTIINGAIMNGRKEESSSSSKKYTVQIVQKTIRVFFEMTLMVTSILIHWRV